MPSFIVDKFIDELSTRLKQQGYQARVIFTLHVSDLEKEIFGQRDDGSLDAEFYQNRLARFSFRLPEDLPKAQSIIIVAHPRPQTRAIFNQNGQRRPLILPPTYTAYDAIEEQAHKAIAAILSERGYVAKRTELPLKLLAVRSGLAQYGRNNITYVSSMGSFLQLAAVYSDMPCERDDWQEKRMMTPCQKCDLCRRACPTGAISSDRFLLHAERCISYHNEKRGDIPFPSWMNASWHNCLVGCMRCQRACPVDREYLQWVEEEEEFSEEETALILQGVPQERLPTTTLKKLKHLDLMDYLNCLPRNLSVFFTKA